VAGVLLDTTVLIDLLRGRTGAAHRISRLSRVGDEPYVCAINVEEVTRGLRPEEASSAQMLFSGLLAIPLGVAEGTRAGQWRRDFASRGITLAQADCLVAAAALAIGGRVATGNPRDFPMREVTVEHWPTGESAPARQPDQ